MTKIIGIIPARYASTRFPGKPLVDIAGKSMIQRVYEQAAKAEKLNQVIVATDDQRILEKVRSFGGNVMMTAEHHQTGTDRCAEVMEALEEVDVVINIQGDEPFIEPEQIDQLAKLFTDANTQIATLIKRIHTDEDLHSNTVIKVVKDNSNNALYFSRAAIPFARGKAFEDVVYYKHIGIYAYRAQVLRNLSQLAQTVLEKTESLEQLRWLENGYTIRLAETQHESNSVDTPEDLERLLVQKGIR